MLDYGQFLGDRPEKAQPFRVPLLCGRVRAEILRERSQRPKVQNYLIYQPTSPNAVN